MFCQQLYIVIELMCLNFTPKKEDDDYLPSFNSDDEKYKNYHYRS